MSTTTASTSWRRAASVDALAEASVRRHSGERRHDGGERPLDGGIEMPSAGERFERESGGFDPFANAAMAEHLDLDPRA